VPRVLSKVRRAIVVGASVRAVVMKFAHALTLRP